MPLGRELLGAEVSQQRPVVDARGAHDRHVVLEERAGRLGGLVVAVVVRVVLLGRHVVRHGLGTGDGARHHEPPVLAADLDRLADDAVLPALGRVEREEQDGLPREAHAPVHLLQVGRRLLALGALAHVRREPQVDARAVRERHRVRRLVGDAQRQARLVLRHRPPERIGHLQLVVLQPVPVVHEHLGDPVVLDQQRVVALARHAGRRPVGAAREHGAWPTVRRHVDHELVVADVGRVVEQPVLDVHARIDQRAPRRRVAAVPLAVVESRVREDQVQPPGIREQQVDQLLVVELVQRQVERPRPREQFVDQRQHVAREVLAVRIVRVRDLLEQLVGGDPAVLHQHVAQPLGRQDAVGERRAEHATPAGRAHGGRLDGRPQVAERARLALVGLHHLHDGAVLRVLDRAAAGIAPDHLDIRWRGIGRGFQAVHQVTHRPHLVVHEHLGGPQAQTVALLAQREVAPLELLDGPDAGVLRQPVRVALAGETDPARAPHAVLLAVPQRDGAVRVQVDPGDLEAEATLDRAVQVPGDVRHLVVGVRTGIDDLSHGPLPCRGVPERPPPDAKMSPARDNVMAVRSTRADDAIPCIARASSTWRTPRHVGTHALVVVGPHAVEPPVPDQAPAQRGRAVVQDGPRSHCSRPLGRFRSIP